MKFHPLAEIFPLVEGKEFDDLCADVRKQGLLEPIITFGVSILDGRNRFRACKKVGQEATFKEYDGDDPLSYVISLNLRRRHMDESQRAMVAAKLANLPARRPANNPANLPTSTPVSQPKAASLLNVSERSVRDAVKVRDHAEPELRRAVESGKLAVSVAAQAVKLPASRQREIAEKAEAGEASAARNSIKKERRAERETELAAKQTALPEKKYGVILADPEWRFEPYSRETGMDRAADNHYPTSEVSDIAARDVASIAADDCALFLWATAPMLPQALAVMAAWGFAYKSHFVWAKDRIGTGYWNRNKHELLLIGTRGAVPAPAMGTQAPSLIEAPAGDHSEKPVSFHNIIELYFPNLPKIELNARRARAGWDAWGYEVPDESNAA